MLLVAADVPVVVDEEVVVAVDEFAVLVLLGVSELTPELVIPVVVLLVPVLLFDSVLFVEPVTVEVLPEVLVEATVLVLIPVEVVVDCELGTCFTAVLVFVSFDARVDVAPVVATDVSVADEFDELLDGVSAVVGVSPETTPEEVLSVATASDADVGRLDSELELVVVSF